LVNKLTARRVLPALSIAVASLVATLPAVPGRAAEDDTVIIATRHAPPFAIRTPQGWEGITIELVHRVAEEQGFSYELREMGLEEMLEATASGEVDAAAAAITVTADREQRLDFTHPFFTSGLGVAVPRRAELTWLSALRRIGSSAFLHAAGALLGILTLVGVLVWAVERRRNEQFPGDPVKGVGSGIWWSAVTMTTVGYGDKAPRTVAGRIIGLVWMFASVIIISGFTAAIATSLTVGQLDKSITGINDLYGKRVLTVGGSTSAGYLDEKLVPYETVSSVEEALDKLAAAQADAVVYDLPILRYLARHSHAQDVRVLPNVFVRQDYGIALPPAARFREQLNRDLLRIIQRPEWGRMLENYLGRND
jgi:polar amino acid transport system substrate-binding protein